MVYAWAFAGVLLAAEKDSAEYVRSLGGRVFYEKGHVVTVNLSLRPETRRKVTDDVLPQLKGLIYLRRLDMSGCKVQSLEKLPVLPYLMYLHLENSDVNDFAVGVIVSRCPALKAVELENTKVTYATFPLLMTHPTLVWLNL